ncbi:hypothetical protein [Pseudomonas chlororaphis]|uniref:Uncharacterized protein n=1 Tax=Pseudomonas chlororaphis TaxID=587753 RepID=A0A1Q8EHS5_9PSED|nr:hypothetical protein [Pseudomonas chlororaphis]OLF51345.1 hypothetical protein BTN82_27460 [Pseudomonas chlororaphis]
MNRQRLGQLPISPRYLQQGLFASLALLVTLIGGQQFSRWEQSQPQAALSLPVHHVSQSHFSAASSGFADSTPTLLMEVDQARPVVDMPDQQRWVF